MSFWDRFVAWLAQPTTWWGDRGLIALTGEHLWISVLSTALAVAIAVPPALWLAHRGLARFSATALANIGRAVPSFGVIVIGAVLFIRAGWPATFWPLIVALVALAIPPVFTNAYTAIAEVDRATIEAARGMGFTERDLLRRVELPLATPLVLEGIRLAFVQVIATATLGAVVSSRGGLGRPIIDGFATFRTGGDVLVVGGAIMVALLTIVADRGFSVAERRLVPIGVRRLFHEVEPVDVGQG
jgi:osmoprotectant transport system permease protein